MDNRRMKTVSKAFLLAFVIPLLTLGSCVAQPANLKPGDRAPDFKLKASDGQEHELAQFAGKKVVAVCWFPRAGSRGAIAQCAALESVMARLPADKLQVFGCSTAALDVTTTFGQAGKYSFPILSDADGTVARAYGCLRADGSSERWIFLIDDKGVLLGVNKTTTPQTQGADLVKMLSDAGLMAAGTVPASQVTTANQQITVRVGAQTRTCLLHLPAGYDPAKTWPLVISLHGARGNGKGMAGTAGFNPMADRYGFIAAYPDGIAGDRTWNALFGKVAGGEGILADEVDDIAFMRALIASLHTTYNTDQARVFVCGHSAGAYMSYRVAVELSDLVAAVGIVNGSLGIKSVDGTPCLSAVPAPVAPVSLIHVCGRQDGLVKYEGGQAPKNLYKSAPDCVQFFVEANGCVTPGKDTADTGNGVTRTLYSGGRNGTEVELAVVANCNHNWPTPQTGLSASQALWDFFASHPKTGGAR